MKPNIVYIASEILVVGKSSRNTVTLRSVLIRRKANEVNTENKYIKTYEFLNVTNDMQLLKTLLLSSQLYMFRPLLAHHQELTKTVRAAYSDSMRQLVNLI